VLTSKQENFCINIVAGMNGKDSYMAAYQNKSNDNTAYKESMKLLSRSDIQDRIKELRKPLELQAQTKALTERDKKKAIIWEELDNAREQQDHVAIARYLDILNKMDQEYININKDISEDKTNIESLDTDTLSKLIN
jgi:hypothetical protein